jgi:hypothetical protein
LIIIISNIDESKVVIDAIDFDGPVEILALLRGPIVEVEINTK